MSTPIALKDITIYPIVEQQGPFFKALEFFPKLGKETLDENRSWLQPTFIDPDGAVVLCIQSFVIQTPHHNILIDSCVGNHKSRPIRPFWNMMDSDRYEKELSRHGPDRQRHRLRDVHAPARRPRRLEHPARQRPLGADLSEGALHHGGPRAGALDSARKDNPQSLPWITDSVLPIVAAKREQIVKSDFAFSETVQLMPTPGHTIDHFSVLVGDRGKDALITGDMIHSPIQGKYPDLGMLADYDWRRPAKPGVRSLTASARSRR